MPEVATSERTLPHNLEAERSVLGAILIHNEAFNFAVELITPRDFFRDAHRRIFEKMERSAERSDAIDLVTLKEALARAAISRRWAARPTSRRSWTASRARPTSSTTRGSSRKSPTLRALISRRSKSARARRKPKTTPTSSSTKRSRRSSRSPRTARASASCRCARSSTRACRRSSSCFEQKKLITGVPTGFTDLDTMTRGLQPADLIIVAARPSMGKTSLVLNIAEHAAIKHGQTVGFFSLEMSREQLFIRLLTSVARIDAHRLRPGGRPARLPAGCRRRSACSSDAKLFIDDTPGVGVLEMRAKARRLAAEHGLSLLVIDYLQLMTGPRPVREPDAGAGGDLARAEGARQGAGRAGRRALAAQPRAREPVPITGRCSRTCASRARSSRTPTSSLMLFRADMYPDAKPEDQGKAELIIAKQRNGPTGTVELAFLKQHTRFEDLARGRNRVIGLRSTGLRSSALPAFARSHVFKARFGEASPELATCERSRQAAAGAFRIV